MTTGTSTRMDV